MRPRLSQPYPFRAAPPRLAPSGAKHARAAWHASQLDIDVIAVNAAWDRFAKESGNPLACATGTGGNYLTVCRDITGAFTDTAQEALAGIQAVLDGSRPQFTLEYPCETPAG
ncbi:MAG: hypothetical protein HY056_14770, partial [Proteobacteria bacterium]|nr:hypothetical protein [Pseudomonadota bacterium]